MGGIKYIKGAVRATPRTLLIQPQANQPMKADTKMDQNKPTQAQKSSTDQLAAKPAGTDKSITGKPPSKVA
jgi:hypothetical protein